MNKTKISPQELYEVMEEKNKLLQIRFQINKTLDKIKQALNSIAVENYQLNQTELDELSDRDVRQQEQPLQSNVELNVKEEMKAYCSQQSVIINQQLINIDLKPSFEEMEIDSDEELDQL